MRRTATAVLVSAVIVSMGPSTGMAATGSVPRNVNVSRLPDNQAETAVAVNPTNPDNVVITSNIASFLGLFEAYSMDGGISWTTQLIADGDRLGLACCDSSLAFDANGNLFLTYLVYAGVAIPVALSIDGGANF